MSDVIATVRQRRLRWAGILAVVLVPLAFVGLYTASVGNPRDGLDHIPAAVVNEDEMVTTTAADGTESKILAGRQLVTELTGSDSPGMDWQLSNASDAAAMLASGQVYAVLTIPSDFSSSIVSLQGSDPEKAQLHIQTDDAHSYLAGTVAQSLGDGMVRTFGSAITENYISGIYASFGQLSEAMTQAADGAGQLSSGAKTAASGATSLSTGLSQYTGGVSQLASGLKKLDAGAAGLDKLSAGVKSYTSGVSQLSAGIAAATAALAADPTDAAALGQLQYLSGKLSQAAAGGKTLATKTSSAVNGIQSGISQSASGASTLAANGPALVSGASGLASGIAKLADGASDLSTGLAEGASKLPSGDGVSSDAAAVAADPVNLTVSTENSVGGAGSAIATVFVPMGLWIGALAMFLVLRPASRRALASTASAGRIISSALTRAGAVAGIQALLLVVLLHTAGGVAWTALPATLPFALLAAAAFTAFHYLLTIGLGRGGLVISLLLLALQVAAIGGILPTEALTGPFQFLRPFLPLAWAVDGMQQLVTGGSAGIVIGAAAALLALTIGSILVAAFAIRRTRNRALRPVISA